MQNLVYTLAALLVILWALGFFVLNSGNGIHMLFVIAVVAIIIKLIRGKEI